MPIGFLTGDRGGEHGSNRDGYLYSLQHVGSDQLQMMVASFEVKIALLGKRCPPPNRQEGIVRQRPPPRMETSVPASSGQLKHPV